MKSVSKVLQIFSRMPRREKMVVLVLAAVFLFSFGKFLIGTVRFPIYSEKGVFAEGIVGSIRHINPLLVDFNDADRDISELVFSGLIRYDPVQKNFFPDLAEKYERSADGRTYTFSLKKNAKWHDGNPVTADDIIFTFRDVIGDPGFRNPILRNAFSGVVVNSANAETVSFTLQRANSYFLSYLTVGLLPAHLLRDTLASNLEKSAFNEKPVGSGPYRVTRVKLDSDGDSVDLEVFPDYYGEKPKMERLRFFTFPDEEELLDERGALHAMSKIGIASEASKKISSDPRFTVYPYTLNQFIALYFRTDHFFLKEKKVRQALALGLPKAMLVAEGEERIDTLDFQNRAGDPRFEPNIEAAKKTLDDMGFRVGQDGFRITPKGEKISLNLLTLTKTPKELNEKIKNAWQEIGVEIQIERLAPEDFSIAVSERRYDLLLIRQNLGYNRDVYSLFHSSQIGSPENRQGMNFSNFKSFGTDGLTEAIRKERNPREKEKHFQKLSEVISDEVPVIFLGTPVYAYAIDKKIEAFPKATLDFHSNRLRILPYLNKSSL